jgi:hypothetical protein
MSSQRPTTYGSLGFPDFEWTTVWTTSLNTSGNVNLGQGNTVFDSTGLLTKYNNSTVYGVGMPTISHYQTNFVNFNGNQTISLLYGGATPPAGMYRINYQLVVNNNGSGGAVAAYITVADAGSITGSRFFPCTGSNSTTSGCVLNFGGAVALSSYAPIIVYSTGAGITLNLQVGGLSGGAAFTWYAILERLA